MAKISDILLRALYVKGSLKNHDDGFEFQMKNNLGPARIVAARPLILDRKPIPLDSCLFVHSGQSASFADVTPETSVLMRKGEAVTVRVDGKTLRRGRHVLGVRVIVKDMGQVSFSVSDQVK
jgi:hypothetical protein